MGPRLGYGEILFRALPPATRHGQNRMTTLRLILGDQLNPLHSWFAQTDDEVIYTLMEIRQETDYVLHHAQKIIGIFAAMRDFAQHLSAQGHRVHYLPIDDSGNRQSLTANLDVLITQYRVQHFEYQLPDEWRLDRQLCTYCQQLPISSRACDSEHFYSQREEAAELFGSRPHWLMEMFYRRMRVRHGVLLEDNQRPIGGQWNFDHDNRKAWPGTPAVAADTRPRHDHSAIWQSIVAAGVNSFGTADADDFRWPLNRAKALQQLEAFIADGLPQFGDFQDAMSRRSWRLFHSLLSFALNTKMLNPREVVERAEQAYRQGHAPLAAAEGFIRQILGWREYVRGVYWARMPDYATHNYFGHARPLPAWFWTGETRMNCLAAAIGQSLQYAYAHHIQRLMVIGNFTLLAGLAPEAVHRWYLGVYIDAFEWVELPNTLGMSQFADGGLLATKPYVSSAAYIDRMSDYCKGCHYDKKARSGERACPFNALYWDFFIRHRDKLNHNPRLSMVYRNLDRFAAAELKAITQRAETVLEDLPGL
ncbi:cryptochrome/photolyase family protein [Methylomonas sp. OY6]|uniref:Cryptochrome/photolyase family protein n=1 Tax=Methylomonas defluvii TaxID=3045149 RepID=A0ABU4U9J1_9GAMM|nr:cryptochrome/photolyase family protein [Methylomonas sp. OY6]MDX8125682.1 cryptochrome/photolyase family protein [Methylomonas sp. OY6]